MRRLIVFTVLAVIVASLYVGVAARSSRSGYPLDDAWIHQTYARNWAETGQLVYVAGLPSAGSTAPLWTLLLSAAYRSNIDPHFWTAALGIASLAISAWLLSHLADRLLPDRPMVSWLTGLACVLEWHLIWAAVSGMETLLFIVLALALIDRVWAGSSGWIIGVLGGLLILTRPEGLLLFVLALGVLLIRPHEGVALPRRDRADSLAEEGKAFARNLREAAKAAVAFLIVLAPGAYFNLQAGGSIFPNTFYAKQSEYGALMRTLPIWLRSIANMLITPLAGGGLLLLPGVVWWIVASVRGVMKIASHSRPAQGAGARWAKALAMAFPQWLPLVWAAAHVMVYALRLPVSYQHGRYLLPIIPILLLYGVVGMALLFDRLKAGRPAARLLRRVYLFVLIILFVLYIPIGAAAFAADVAIINGEMVAVAQWLDRNTPPDALIAAHDIGAIGYFTRRPILDLAGLISPEVIPFIRDEAKLDEWLKAKGARYLVTFPDWYPQLSASPDLIELYAGDSAATADHMTVYVFRR